MDFSVVIIGAGQAASQAVASLRTFGHKGPITVVGDEPYPPYQRPPLSKKFLAGEFDQERLAFKPVDFYTQNGGVLKVGQRCEEIDRGSARIRLSGGETIPYDKLLISTGSRPRHVPVEGVELEGVHSLRTIDDVLKIREGFRAGRHIVIIGGGYIGLEVAAIARHMDLRASIIELGERCLSRVTCEEVSSFFEAFHRKHGVEIHTGEGLSAFEGEDRLRAVHTKSGTRIEADLALVGIGILPNFELAEASGLDCENGIKVDEFAMTSDPNIFAAGDCTSLPSKLYGRRIRLESVHNAIEQAKTAAATMMGKPQAYDQVPWFWSDQYDLKLQIAGLNQGYTHVVIRGDIQNHKFAAFYLKDQQLIAVDAINSPSEYMIGRKLIGRRAEIPAKRLADMSVSMKEIAG